MCIVSFEEDIFKHLNQITNSIDVMLKKVKQVMETIDENSASMTELKLASDHIAKTAEKVSNLI